MKVNPEDLRRPSWACVHFLSAEQWSEPGGDLTVLELDGNDLASEAALIDAIGEVFKFPEFGKNWDAVTDYLRDLSWLPAPGYVLVIRNARTPWHETPLVAGKLTNTWMFVAESWAKDNVSFHLVWNL